MSEHCEANLEKIEDLKKTVYGNGKPGLAYEIVSIRVKLNILITMNVAIVIKMLTEYIRN